MNTFIAPRGAAVAAAFTSILLAACAKQEQVSEVEWAKAALARNPALEIISTDETAGTFSVRDTSTGATYKLNTQELMAAPLPKLVAAATPAPATAPASETPAQPEVPAETDEAAAEQTTEAAVRGSGQSLAEGPGYSISRGHAQDAAPTKTMEGPGYSITREASTAQPVTTPAETAVTGIEKRTDPIICQGDRLMHIDGETIEFTGDAVIAEKGCDLYISNARISAGGVGIIARQARVHIVNSTIGGTRGSYEVSDGAELYAARSTFSGIGRRFDTAAMNDLGGNEYLVAH